MRRLLNSIRFCLHFTSRSYTDQAVNALFAARRLAAGNNRDIDPEHVLFGLAGLRGGAALVALKTLGLNLGFEGEAIMTSTGLRSQGSCESFPTLDTRTEQLLSRAEEHARGLGLNYVGSEHLVLGLLSGTGPSAEYLRGRGITPELFLTQLRIVYAGSRSAGQ
jgi:ATP-dependent Clp protease ATP-binding subunit ClpC